MNFPHKSTVPKDPAPMQVALATLAPLLVGILATRATMLADDRFGMDIVPFVLVGWCVVLFASAVWLNRVLFHGVKALLPPTSGIIAILSIWLWQRLAFVSLVPHSGLTYGYFLKPDGAAARFWILSCPFWVGFTCLSACFVAALLLNWRAGARRALVCIIPWWLVAFLIFALPSMYLDMQGNASIFI